MVEEVPVEAFDRFDWIYFIAGTSFTLLAVVAIKYILDGGGGSCYHSHFHGVSQGSHHGSVYGMDNEGKLYRRGYL